MNTIWIRHAETGGEAEVPEAALPIYRQSGWDLMSDKDVAKREKEAADALAAAERAMIEGSPSGAAAEPESATAKKKGTD